MLILHRLASKMSRLASKMSRFKKCGGGALDSALGETILPTSVTWSVPVYWGISNPRPLVKFQCPPFIGLL